MTNTPDSPAQRPDDRMTLGGKFWTLFTQGIWKDLHAVLHLSREGHEIIDFGDDIGNKRRGSTPIAGNTRLLLALKEAKLRAKTPYVIEFKGEHIKDVKTALTSLCKRTKVEKISAHVLKHTAITWMVQADMTNERISKFANTTKEVIERVYGHHSMKFVQEASSALSFYFCSLRVPLKHAARFVQYSKIGIFPKMEKSSERQSLPNH